MISINRLSRERSTVTPGTRKVPGRSATLIAALIVVVVLGIRVSAFDNQPDDVDRVRTAASVQAPSCNHPVDAPKELQQLATALADPKGLGPTVLQKEKDGMAEVIDAIRLHLPPALKEAKVSGGLLPAGSSTEAQGITIIRASLACIQIAEENQAKVVKDSGWKLNAKDGCVERTFENSLDKVRTCPSRS